MPVTVNINGLSAVHQGSNGIAMATAPDVCLTPGPPSGPVPVPYPNIAMSSDLVSGTTTVTIDGSPAAIQGSKFVKSTGDQAGAAGGVASGVFGMEAAFISFSPTVMLEGKAACRLTDKMTMNKSNTVCACGELQGPVAPGVGDEATCGPAGDVSPQEPKRCVLRTVYVKCGHSSRDLQIDLSKGDMHAVKVISKADEPDKMQVEWDGNCEYGHSSYCPTVGVVDQNNKFTAIKPGPVEMPLPNFFAAKDPLWALKTLLLSHEIPHGYRTINSLLCCGHPTADVGANQWIQVQIYPELSCKAEMTLGYSRKNAKDADGRDKPLAYEEKTTWEFGGEFSGKFAAQSLKLEGSSKMEALPMFGSLLKPVGWLTTVFDSMASRGLDVKLTPRWPKWKISGGGLKLVELKGKPDLGCEGSFEVGFDPLFGMELSASILDWLIRFAGGLAGPPGALVAQALVQIRQRFAKKINWGAGIEGSLDIDIVIVIGGQIDGGFGFKFNEGKSEVDDEATGLGGSVDIKVEGRIIGKGKIWKVEVTGAGKLGSSSADSVSVPTKFGGKVTFRGDKKNPMALKGSLDFNGLAFYYLLYLEVGVGGADSTEEHENEETMGEVKASHKFEKKGSAVLLTPWNWPKEGGSGE